MSVIVYPRSRELAEFVAGAVIGGVDEIMLRSSSVMLITKHGESWARVEYDFDSIATLDPRKLGELVAQRQRAMFARGDR